MLTGFNKNVAQYKKSSLFRALKFIFAYLLELSKIKKYPAGKSVDV